MIFYLRLTLSISFLMSQLILGIGQKPVDYSYDASTEFPFGKLNPEAPPQLSDYAMMIGTCDCESIVRKQDDSWAEPVSMTWTFRYIMNGMAVQDETLKADGKNSGSIRLFISDLNSWFVHYYTPTSQLEALPSWKGHPMQDNEIVLHSEQKAPNGMDGYYRTHFYNISEDGYKWKGSWVTDKENEQFKKELWKINCTKRR